MLKAVIFDFDGVIVDTESVFKKIYTSVFKELDINITTKEMLQVQGAPRHKLKDFLSGELIKKKSKLTGEELFCILLNKANDYIQKSSIPLIPNIKKLILHLVKNNIRLAIASSASTKYIKTIISKHHLSDSFEIIVGIEDVKEGKPAPDLFFHTADLLNLKSQNIVIIEDSMNGIEAALKTDIKCIGYNPLSDQDLSKAHFVVNDINELNVDIINNILRLPPFKRK